MKNSEATVGKAQRFKAERREQREIATVSQARRRHLGRWLVGAAVFSVLAAFGLPTVDQKYLNSYLKNNLTKASPTPVGTASEGAKPVENIGTKIVTIQTPKGAITMELYGDQAPKTVGHIVALIDRGFYNGLTFHRVEPGFVIQGGDPKGDGSGGSGETVAFEKNGLTFEKGVVGLARSQSKDSGDSQFFIMLEANSNLNGEYVAFGKVTAGMEVVGQIQQGDKMTSVTVR